MDFNKMWKQKPQGAITIVLFIYFFEAYFKLLQVFSVIVQYHKDPNVAQCEF